MSGPVSLETGAYGSSSLQRMDVPSAEGEMEKFMIACDWLQSLTTPHVNHSNSTYCDVYTLTDHVQQGRFVD